MKNAVSWFEIPVNDIKRAKAFYEGILSIDMLDLELENNLKMAIFPSEESGIGGALCEHHDFYKPVFEGSMVYLNANPDLSSVVSKIEEQGGKIIIPKTQISENFGYMAVFIDCEGNRVALHSNK